ncbi:tetratricopeptide repeat protein [Lusitaniella coriacea LEGE 07157]|uniref:Tetratricopeptide repeat protein n=1 Tax=Lusitaniella coriacea LEGE 07157 TaxID=945747 RepID=A0A8J7DT32_9CYAN|nr:tetratricopeptide repeat protein [Lusitaniella coriacea]MBE9115237.1 tetratricopeptide repeat protein [Lusitaniella coriacea LEGE 07157]
MIRWILSLLCFLLVAIASPTALAQTTAMPNYSEAQLQQGDRVAQKALKASQQGDFATAERYWTQLIEEFPENPAVWSNRGNIRVGQNRLDDAIADFNQSIQLAPKAPDPYLNRGTVYEAKGKFADAIADYNKVLELNPEDSFAYNNRGNAEAGLGKWQRAIADYKKATDLEPTFAFARANYALALYQAGDRETATQIANNLARKYPLFPDVRAALTAILWEQGKQGEAESNWVAAVGLDNRYQDIEWVKTVRRWPPAMVDALDKFLNLD